MNTIEYYSDRAISAEQFIDVLERSTLAERCSGSAAHSENA